MTHKIITYYEEHPLRTILFAGLFFRLLAVIFSKGYGWVDDQFLIVEIAQSWVDGVDYYRWLPDAKGVNTPQGFSFFYVGLHYLLFRFLELIRITDPESKMYVVRLLHALWSLLIITGGYKIIEKLGDKSSAKLGGWLLAVLWLFPFLSVRNLVEYVSIPLLVWGVWLSIDEKPKKAWQWLWIGFLFGLAFNIRFQTLIFTGGVGMVLLFQRKWKETFLTASGVVAAIVLFQGGTDYVVWHKPFVQLIGYFDYNLHHANDYLKGPWYFYLTVILGLLIPPVSLYLFAGFFRSWKKAGILFFPSLLFLLFHSFFPNKQERFIVTIIPFVIIGGVIGWKMIMHHVEQRPVLTKWLKGSWVFFWVLNFILLLPVTVMYSKKARVEVMVYLSRYDDLRYFIIEDVNKSVLRQPPLFYLHKWIPFKAVMAYEDLDNFRKSEKKKSLEQQAGFVLFMEETRLDERVKFMKTVYPELELEALIHPGYMDRVIHWLNPINDNQNIYIYRNKAVYPEKLRDE